MDSNFLGIYVYGSQITTKDCDDSDIDIVGVYEQDIYNSIISQLVIELDAKYDVVIDFQRFSLAQLQQDSYYYNEVKKGVYYAK